MSLSEFVANWRIKQAFKAARVTFLEDLGEVLMSGGGKLQAKLERLARRNDGKPLGQAYTQIHRVLVNGGTLSKAVQPFFSQKEHQLIDAYDAGAKDDVERGEGFLVVAKIIQPLEDIRSKAIGVLVKTGVSLVILIAMWVGVAGGIARDMGQLLPRTKWPAVSQAVVGSGEWLGQHWYVAAPLAAALIALVVWSLSNWVGGGRRWADQKMPGFVIFREYRSTVTLVALAAYLRSKKGLAYSFKKLGANSNKWELEYLDEMSRRSARLGGSAMLDVGFFSERMIDRVSLREDAMSLEQTLEVIGLQQAAKVIESLKIRLQVSSDAIETLTKVAGALVFVAIVLIIFTATKSLQASG